MRLDCRPHFGEVRSEMPGLLGCAPRAWCGTAKPRTGPISDAQGMLELLWLLAMAVLAGLRPHQDLVLQNLLLRHQLLASLLGPVRDGGTRFGGEVAWPRLKQRG
jgi:hypothetical protein